MISLFRRAAALGLLLLLAACTGLPPVSQAPDKYVVAYGAEGRLFRTPDNLSLFGQWWTPPADKPVKSVVLLVHGTALHSGFYAPWADQLSFKGYAVLGLDLQGWGQSQGWGRRGYVKNYDDYVRDLRLAAAEIRQRYPGLPIFLQGESLGGAVALLAASHGSLPVAGLVLNAPAVQPNPGLGFMRLPTGLMKLALWGAGTAGKVWPNFPAIPLNIRLAEEQGLKAVFFDDYTRRRFLNDALNTHSALPAAYITGLQDATARLAANLVNVQQPLLVLQGTDDALVPPSSSDFLMATVGSPDKTLKRYEGMSHTTLHDTGHEQVWADIIAWLDQRVVPGALAPAAPTSRPVSQR